MKIKVGDIITLTKDVKLLKDIYLDERFCGLKVVVTKIEHREDFFSEGNYNGKRYYFKYDLEQYFVYKEHILLSWKDRFEVR